MFMEWYNKAADSLV